MTLRDRKGPQGGPYRGIIYMEDHKRNLTRDHSGAFMSVNMGDRVINRDFGMGGDTGPMGG